ncbi:MAG: dodecin family protein [Methanothrix sp.]
MMQERVYPIIELVGSSPTSWEEAAKNAIEMASRSLWNLKIAEVKELDVKIDDQGNIIAYRVKLRFSLKYDDWKKELGWKAPQV